MSIKQLIPPGAAFDNVSNPIILSSEETENVQQELIKELERLPGRNDSWPKFTPLK